MIQRSNQQRGFTLLEMLVYMAVLVGVVSAVIVLLLWVVRSNTKVAVTGEVGENARNAITIMENEIREADSIYTPTTSATQLSLATRRNLPVGEDATYIDFFLCGTRLCLKREEQSAIALTSEQLEVTNLQFKEVTTGSIPSVHISFDLEYANPSGRPELDASFDASVTVSLRY